MYFSKFWRHLFCFIVKGKHGDLSVKFCVVLPTESKHQPVDLSCKRVYQHDIRSGCVCPNGEPIWRKGR